MLMASRPCYNPGFGDIEYSIQGAFWVLSPEQDGFYINVLAVYAVRNCR